MQPSAIRHRVTEADAVKPSMTSSAFVSLALEGTGARQVITDLIIIEIVSFIVFDEFI